MKIKYFLNKFGNWEDIEEFFRRLYDKKINLKSIFVSKKNYPKLKRIFEDTFKSKFNNEISTILGNIKIKIKSK